MNTTDADQLLRDAFPYGALVYAGDSREFFALDYEIRTVDAARVEVRFVRNPGDTLTTIFWETLQDASTSGVLEAPEFVARRPHADDLVSHFGTPLPDYVFDLFLGPQVHRERGWIARMRLHQTWWRTFVLRVPFGTGPTSRSTRTYGNMLDETGEAEGLNFLSQEARHSFEQRLATRQPGVNRFRTARHLLSSQAMAFNLFGHLSHHPDVASNAMAKILGVQELVVDSIEIERLSDAIADRTAFDAFATYTTPNGRGCIGIETKLTEHFSQQAYDWSHYLALPAFTGDIWTTDDPAKLGDRRWSQLWRNHLLLVAESSAHGFPSATQLVVHHPMDHSCTQAVDGYRSLLHNPDLVRAVPLDQWYEALADQPLDHHNNRWLDAFRTRYLDLGASATLAV